MGAPAKIRYTYEDWLAIPEDRSRRYEILDGELFVNPAPRPRHQDVVNNIAHVLTSLALEHGLGKVLPGTGLRLAIATVVEPDILFIASSRLGIIDWDACVTGPPDLVIEVLSPSNRKYDRTLKRTHYLAGGVAELWIVDADERSIEVWRPGEEPRTIAGDAVEWRVGERAFEVRMADVFRG